MVKNACYLAGVAVKSKCEKITTETVSAFDGDIMYLRLSIGKHGPFYRVSKYRLRNTSDFKKKARFCRSGILKKWKDKSCDKAEFECFLEDNTDKINKDPTFALAGQLGRFFTADILPKVQNDFVKISRERWVGLVKPKNFKEACRWHYLVHLHEKKKYLYEIYLKVSTKGPGLHFGKTKDGTGIQFKMNNYAVESVASFKCLAGPWGPCVGLCCRKK